MKFFGYILSFYLILLATVPCCAIDHCNDNKTGQATDHKEEDKDCGNCSPFFNCEGCATATIIYQPVQFDFRVAVVSPVYPFYQHPSLTDADIDFWQPPKIG